MLRKPIEISESDVRSMTMRSTFNGGTTMKARLIVAVAVSAVAGPFIGWDQASAQNRGVYPLGMSATNSGSTAEPGFTYANLFLFYSRSESRGPDGLCVDQATQDSKGFRQRERFAPRPRAIRGIARQFR